MRLMIVRVGAMGDILHALPAVTAWRARNPGATIGWVAEPHWAPLLADTTLIDRVHLAPTREWKRRPFASSTLRSIAKLRGELRQERYDVCVDLQGSIRSAVIARMSGARRVIGADAPRERPARMFYGERVRTYAAHVIEHACALLSAIDGNPLTAQAVRLSDDPAAEIWAAEIAAEDAREFVLLVPGAGWGAKQWPADHFRELAAALGSAGYRVLINASPAVSTPGPPSLAARIAAGTGAEIVPCTLAQLIALTRRAALVIGGDTGPVHLAAALGRPVIALFGPTDPARNGPALPCSSSAGSDTVVLRSEQSRTDHRRLDVVESGLATIAPAQVIELALGRLERVTGRLAQTGGTLQEEESDG